MIQGMSNEQNAMVLHQALDSVLHLSRYPKSIIEVCVMVLEDDGGKGQYYTSRTGGNI